VTEIERLWAEHLTAEFPSIPGADVHGIDLVLLDADIAGYVTTFLDNGGRLAPARRASLEGLAKEARRVAQAMTGAERAYFSSLAHVADLVVSASRPGTAAS
jgi:hypothetical protein